MKWSAYYSIYCSALAARWWCPSYFRYPFRQTTWNESNRFFFFFANLRRRQWRVTAVHIIYYTSAVTIIKCRVPSFYILRKTIIITYLFWLMFLLLLLTLKPVRNLRRRRRFALYTVNWYYITYKVIFHDSRIIMLEFSNVVIYSVLLSLPIL